LLHTHILPFHHNSGFDRLPRIFETCLSNYGWVTGVVRNWELFCQGMVMRQGTLTGEDFDLLPTRRHLTYSTPPRIKITYLPTLYSTTDCTVVFNTPKSCILEQEKR
ncbi:MAG: hypothetical protein ACK55Z_02600, partial [bacterium]